MMRIFVNDSCAISNRAAAAVALLVLVLSAPAYAQDTPPGTTTWPLRVDTPSGQLAMYQPQPDKFEGNTLNARAAVSLTPPGAANPEFGAMWMQARVLTDRDAHTVTIENMTVRRVNLPSATPEQQKQFSDILSQQIPTLHVVMPLEQLEATLSVVQKAKEESQELNNTPPKIMFTTMPTTLVVLDGPPKLQATQTMGVMRVVNTPFVLLLEMQSKVYYLKAGAIWETAPDVTGPWAIATNVPESINHEGTTLTGPPTADTAPATPTQILVSEEPAEVISSDGQPTFTPLPGNNLLYMSNTQSNVFLEVASQQYYVLLSGRWFMAHSLEGPWSFVAADKLPAAFAQIPPDSAKASVLVSVAGTQQAKDARMDAYIPQTAAINRNAGASLSVTYDGPPQFATIENSTITYAKNCALPVLDVNNTYYCCSQAVWYQSASPTGPWAVCTSVPDAIYTIPPSCPVYYCRYAYVYDSTPQEVYCGYLPGYTGSYVYGPTVVYGTGYNYPGWFGQDYYPSPYTWGFGADYDFSTGMWGFGETVDLGPSWFGRADLGRHWWGPQGYIDGRSMRDNRGRSANLNGNHDVGMNRINLYSREANAKRNVVISGSLHNSRSEPAHADAAHADATHAPAENNVYVGGDGQVYRRSGQGWESNSGKGWTTVKPAEISPRDTNQPGHFENQGEIRGDNTNREVDNILRQQRETPARETPARETPMQQSPARAEQPMQGLEQERAARERFSSQQPSFGGGERSGGGGGGAVEHTSGGGGGAESHGGGGGGGRR